MLKKLLKWLFYSLLTLILGISLSIYLFKDRIIQEVLTEVNDYLSVPVNVSRVDIDFLHGLPNISIAFYDVELPADAEPVVTAKRFYAIINPIQIIRGNLTIEKLEIIDAEINIIIDTSNKNNISRLFKSPESENLNKEDTVASGFDLNSIVLHNVDVDYQNNHSKASAKLNIRNLIGDFRLHNGIYMTSVDAAMDISGYRSPAWSVADVGEFTCDFDLAYDVESKILKLEDSQFSYRGAEAGINGSIAFASTPKVDLKISADKVSFNHLSQFLPRRFTSYIEQYNSKGSIDFDASIAGNYSRNLMPELKATLAFKNVDLTDANYNAHIRDLDLNCQLNIKDLGNLATGKFYINEGKGFLQKKPFTLTFQLSDFNNPVYSGSLKADITTSWLLAAMKFKEYNSGQGEIDVSLKVQRKSNQKPVFSGSIDLQAVSLALNDSVRISRVNGLATFNPGSIALADMNVSWLTSDLIMEGEIEMNGSGAKTDELMLRSNVKSTKLAIEDVVALVSSSAGLFTPDSTENTDLKLNLELLATLDSLTFRRFKGAAVTGEIFFQDKVIEVVDLNGRAMGGMLNLNGKMKQMPNKDIVIQANAKTKGVYLDSLFYVFNNFTQDFIRQEHLKGRVYADVNASMYFDETWRFRRQLLSANAKLGIVEGQLNNFEPIMALAPYLDDKDDNLARLRFSDIVNNIQIRQDTVFIPEMSIRTNVRNIALGGYHTLGQYINYQLAVPIINERVDKDEAFGAIQKSSKGSPNLLFRIKGTTSDYKVNYDLLRATGNVLRLLDITQIFKKKEEAEIDSSFLEDDEFDWQNE